MTDETKPTNQIEPTVAPAAAPAPTEAPAMAEAPPVEPGEIGVAQLKEIVAALQAELDAKLAQLDARNDQLLRAHADMDNMRKRVEREKEETAKYAITKFARDVVNVADNFERAIASVPAEAKVDNPALNALIDGVSLTEREFLLVLERHGVKRIDPKDEIFNPHQHQAVMENHNPEVAPGTVLQVFQPGYLIDDRVLRPAMVVVAKGGAKAAKAADAAPAPAEDEITPESPIEPLI